MSSLSGYLDNPDGSLGLGLTIETDMLTIVKAMASSDSGLDVKDRMWLKITIPKAFIGKKSTCFDLIDRNRKLTYEQKSTMKQSIFACIVEALGCPACIADLFVSVA